jgi:hypothetical protein
VSLGAVCFEVSDLRRVFFFFDIGWRRDSWMQGVFWGR